MHCWEKYRAATLGHVTLHFWVSSLKQEEVAEERLAAYNFPSGLPHPREFLERFKEAVLRSSNYKLASDESFLDCQGNRVTFATAYNELDSKQERAYILRFA